MFKMSTNSVEGRYKTSLKSKTYSNSVVFSFLFLFIGVTFFILSNSENARAKKSVKRAAASSSSSKPSVKRAATKGNAKRAATSGTAKRAAGSASARKVVNARSLRGNAKKDSSTTADTTTSSTSTGNICPIGVMLKKALGNDGVVTYYSEKNTVCKLPEDNVSVVNQWVKTNASSYPMTLQNHPSWMSDSEAVYLTCTSGYVEKTVDKVKTCVMTSGICPLGEIVEKSGDGFIHPLTRETCVAPENAVVSNVRGEENTLSYSVADDNAYKFECPLNYYSVLTNTSPALRVGCVACPNGYSAPVGATSLAGCVKNCAEYTVLVSTDTGSECKSCAAGAKYVMSTKSCQPLDGYKCNDTGTECWEDEEVVAAKEAEKKAAEEKALAEKKAAEEKALAEKKAAEEKAALEAQLKKEKEAVIATKTEAERLAKLRIEKRNDGLYYCIYGWTNKWDIIGQTVGKDVPMDKDGIITNIVLRNTFGKNKKGCPIRQNKNLSKVDNYKSITSTFYPSGKPLDVRLCRGSSSSGVQISSNSDIPHRLSQKQGLLKYKMKPEDIDNTGKKGWTEEEYNAWGGYAPIQGVYYETSTIVDKLKNYTFNTSIGKTCIDYTVFESRYIFFADDLLNFDVIKDGTYTDSNLFTYWD